MDGGQVSWGYKVASPGYRKQRRGSWLGMRVAVTDLWPRRQSALRDAPFCSDETIGTARGPQLQGLVPPTNFQRNVLSKLKAIPGCSFSPCAERANFIVKVPRKFHRMVTCV